MNTMCVCVHSHTRNCLLFQKEFCIQERNINSLSVLVIAKAFISLCCNKQKIENKSQSNVKVLQTLHNTKSYSEENCISNSLLPIM